MPCRCSPLAKGRITTLASLPPVIRAMIFDLLPTSPLCPSHHYPNVLLISPNIYAGNAYRLYESVSLTQGTMFEFLRGLYPYAKPDPSVDPEENAPMSLLLVLSSQKRSRLSILLTTGRIPVKDSPMSRISPLNPVATTLSL
ncbi:hypothetical protein L198_05968 [Cryptococcus wingfieldii CBS 7118]|uniref:Uncharacterized protein n=1 Tax=Cryptococcus wingfieldii CBS 7118 TaxID=1295528 RepID=A0A1E3ISA7_9TREE|nr:hypothetical protein L198_05968 [Cryptococcus wingfieldii CBS 7118]ODN91452.1 hypothetical protein L198_05968 [Cryptococcus wingfieldii CBS 7118]